MSWWLDAGNALGPFEPIMILVIFIWVVGHMLYNALGWASAPPFGKSTLAKPFAGAGW